MRSACALFLVTFLSALVCACTAGGGQATDVPLIPDIWAVSAMHGGKLIVVDPTVANTAEFQASFAPVVTGFHANTALVVGDTFTSGGPGGTSMITTTISTENGGRDNVFSGQFDDTLHANGYGHYTLRHHKRAGTFEFDQTVIYRWTAGTVTTTMLVTTEMTGEVAADGSYTGTGTAWSYQHVLDTVAGTATAAWTAFTGKMLSKDGFYGVMCLQATGPTAYVPYPGTAVVPEYTDTTLISALKALTVSYPWPYLAYHDTSGWALVSDPGATALWAAHGGT
jgi:hypothetical protein